MLCLSSSLGDEYPGCLGDRNTGLAAQTLEPKKFFSSFSFFSCISTKNALNQLFISIHLVISKNPSSYFETDQQTKMLTEEQNNGTKRRRSEKRNGLRKSFHSFKYLIKDHANTVFFFLILFTNLPSFIKCHKQFNLLLVISSVLLAASFQLRSLCSFHYSIVIKNFKNHPHRRVFHNVN